jgi:hypothetical protein
VTTRPVSRDPAVRWRRCLDGVVVMGRDAHEPLFLTAPGDAIWGLLAQPRTVDELVGELAAEFTGDRSAIAGDVAAFVADLARAGLVDR